MNAQVGKCDCEEYDTILGPFGIETRNDKGSDLLQTYQCNGLCIMNACFQHEHYATHQSSNEQKTESMIDTIAVSQQRRIRRLFWDKMIAHRRDPENNPIPVRPNPDASFNPRSPEEPQTMRTLRHLQTPEIGPLLQIDHLPLHQDKDNNQNALEALNLEKVAHTTQCK
jgi:hypothetical protein